MVDETALDDWVVALYCMGAFGAINGDCYPPEVKLVLSQSKFIRCSVIHIRPFVASLAYDASESFFLYSLE